jgi:hypothetical protein
MIANYGQPKDKITSTTMKQPEEHPAEPKAKNCEYNH